MRTVIAFLFVVLVTLVIGKPLLSWRQSIAEEGRRQAEADVTARREADVRAELRTIRDESSRGELSEARDHCEQLRQRELPPGLQDETESLCEFTSLALLRRDASATRPDFVQAAELVSTILSGTQSGAEPEAAQIAFDLAERHLVLARQDLEAGDVVAIRRHLALLSQLRTDDPVIAATVRNWVQDASAALLRHAYTTGDVDALLQQATKMPADAPLPLRSETVRLVESAMSAAVEARHADGDVAGAYELLDVATQRNGLCPALMRSLEGLRSRYLERVFGKASLSPKRMHLPPVIPVDQNLGPDSARITITNSGATPLTILLRGSSSQDLTVAPKGERAVDVRPGRLLALFQAGRRSVTTGVTTIELREGEAYRQMVQL